MSSRESGSTPCPDALFLGADGGGTSTGLCLLRGDGRVLARADAPSSYYLGHGTEVVSRVLADGVRQVCAAAGIDRSAITFAFFGLPGYGEVSGDVATLDGLPAAALGHDRYRCDNDMVCGWAGSLGGADGINVVSGTGSIAYGEIGDRMARVGGWGEVFGDEGSAYWIAVRGLGLFSRMSDGRMPRGLLYEVVRDHLDLDDDLDLVDLVLNRWASERGRVAAMSRVVALASEAGDRAATRVLDDAAAALAEHVQAVRDQLRWPPDRTVPVSWSGGVFASDRVRDGFAARLADPAAPGDYEPREPLHDPVLGAALYAARLAGTPLPAHLEIA